MILSDSDETDNDDTVAIVNDAKKRRELAQQFEIEHAEDDSPHRYGTRALMYDTDKADNVWWNKSNILPKNDRNIVKITQQIIWNG